MTSQRRPSAAQRRAAAQAEAETTGASDAADAPAPDAPGAPDAAAPDAAAPDAAAPDAGAPDAETPGLVDRAKSALGIGSDDDGDGEGEDESADPEKLSSDGEQTCVHPTCEDPTIPAGEEYFMSTAGPAQGPMHHSCSHKTIPIRR